MNINSIRKEYRQSVLSRKNINRNPLKQFEKWLGEAITSEIPEPTAMTLSTHGPDGFPQARIVLLKHLDEEGFVFFSNYASQKGKSIAQNPLASLLFFWPELERQVRIEGITSKISRKDSQRYFDSRPYESRIGAWSSEQSQIIPSRNYLEDRFAAYQQKFKNQSPPLPSNWGGYLLKPEKIEFWQGRENRLHDRILYLKENNAWVNQRLAP